MGEVIYFKLITIMQIEKCYRKDDKLQMVLVQKSHEHNLYFCIGSINLDWVKVNFAQLLNIAPNG